MSLKQCIEYGLTNNRNNKIYANDILAAEAKAKEVAADYLPKVSLSKTLDNNLKLQQTVIPGGVFGDEQIKVLYHLNLELQIKYRFFSLLVNEKSTIAGL